MEGGGGGVDATPPQVFFKDFFVGIFSTHLSISVAVSLSLRHLL